MSPNTFSFNVALDFIKKGFRVARLGWNGKDMFVFQQIGNTVSKEHIPRFTSIPESVKTFLQNKDEDVVFHPSLTMYNAKGEMQPGWIATQSDLLTEDWVLVD